MKRIAICLMTFVFSGCACGDPSTMPDAEVADVMLALSDVVAADAEPILPDAERVDAMATDPCATVDLTFFNENVAVVEQWTCSRVPPAPALPIPMGTGTFEVPASNGSQCVSHFEPLPGTAGTDTLDCVVDSFVSSGTGEIICRDVTTAEKAICADPFPPAP